MLPGSSGDGPRGDGRPRPWGGATLRNAGTGNQSCRAWIGPDGRGRPSPREPTHSNRLNLQRARLYIWLQFPSRPATARLEISETAVAHRAVSMLRAEFLSEYFLPAHPAQRDSLPVLQ